MNSLRSSLLILAASVVGAGCGTPAPPVAAAGMDRTVAVGQVIALDGSGSSDPAMKPLAYHWELFALPAGSRALLNGSAASSAAIDPSFVADVAGDYVVRLEVSSDSGTSKASDVKITATPCAPMIAPIVATPGMPATGQLVQLATTVSEACDDHPPYRYAWHVDSQPATSRAQLTSSTGSSPALAVDSPGDYVFSLRVTDEVGRFADAAPFTLHASMCGSAPPVAQIGLLSPASVMAPVPAPPMVAARVPIGTSVQLDGGSSSTADNAAPCSLNKALYYKWRFVTLPLGSTAGLNDAQVISPTFDVDVVGVYVLELVVTDSSGLSSAPVRVQINGYNPRFAVPSGSGPFNSLVLDPTAMAAPRIAYYNASRNRAEIAICTGSCDTTPAWTIRLIEDGSRVTPTSNDVGQFISLAVGPAPTGILYAAYFDATNCQSLYSFSTDHGNTWTTRVIDPSPQGCAAATQNGRWTTLALAPSTNNPGVAYQFNQQVLKYALCTANCTSTTTPPTWLITTVDAANPNTGFYNSLPLIGPRSFLRSPTAPIPAADRFSTPRARQAATPRPFGPRPRSMPPTWAASVPPTPTAAGCHSRSARPPSRPSPIAMTAAGRSALRSARPATAPGTAGRRAWWTPAATSANILHSR